MQLYLIARTKSSSIQIFDKNGSERIKLSQCSGKQDAGLQRCFRTEHFLRVLGSKRLLQTGIRASISCWKCRWWRGDCVCTGHSPARHSSPSAGRWKVLKNLCLSSGDNFHPKINPQAANPQPNRVTLAPLDWQEASKEGSLASCFPEWAMVWLEYCLGERVLVTHHLSQCKSGKWCWNADP